LTFSDPQPKDEKGTKRITSGKFIERYRKFLTPEGTIKVKSDSALLYALSKEDYLAAGYPLIHDSGDVYGGFLDTVNPALREALEIKTYYEKRWLEEGKKIHFLEIKPAALPTTQLP
jgi:tRNA (guanine-N7-)-methyltransferase